MRHPAHGRACREIARRERCCLLAAKQKPPSPLSALSRPYLVRLIVLHVWLCLQMFTQHQSHPLRPVKRRPQIGRQGLAGGTAHTTFVVNSLD